MENKIYNVDIFAKDAEEDEYLDEVASTHQLNETHEFMQGLVMRAEASGHDATVVLRLKDANNDIFDLGEFCDLQDEQSYLQRGTHRAPWLCVEIDCPAGASQDEIKQIELNTEPLGSVSTSLEVHCIQLASNNVGYDLFIDFGNGMHHVRAVPLEFLLGFNWGTNHLQLEPEFVHPYYLFLNGQRIDKLDEHLLTLDKEEKTST